MLCLLIIIKFTNVFSICWLICFTCLCINHLFMRDSPQLQNQNNVVLIIFFCINFFHKVPKTKEEANARKFHGQVRWFFICWNIDICLSGSKSFCFEFFSVTLDIAANTVMRPSKGAPDVAKICQLLFSQPVTGFIGKNDVLTFSHHCITKCGSFSC